MGEIYKMTEFERAQQDSGMDSPQTIVVLCLCDDYGWSHYSYSHWVLKMKSLFLRIRNMDVSINLNMYQNLDNLW